MSEHETAEESRRRAYEAGRLTTTDGKPPQSFETPAPGPIESRTGQHSQYWVLSEAERAKGFVRPVRQSYRHVGIPGPAFPLADLSEEDQQRYASVGYVKFERYPPGESSAIGRYWTQKQLDSVGKGCGTVTTMGRALAETYAREPRFYGSTMCVGCGTHLPVGRAGEFVWDGTDERVGT
jgi:hypothetical protein